MEHTAMWQEVHDQPEVAEKILNSYFPKAEYFHELLKKKKRLILTGMGASLYASKMAKYLFYKYGGLFPQVVQADELEYLLPSVDQDTLMIFISQSGGSYETKVVTRELKERGIEFWGITNNPDSDLGRNASEVMLLHCDKEVSSATKTNMASFLILAIIAAGYVPELREEFLELPDKISGALQWCDDQARENGGKVLEELAKSLIPELQLYELGMGVHGTTAIEGALMMKEKTFIHTAGSSISDFRHGTVEVIEDGLPVILLSSGEKNLKMAENHAVYLKNTGADVTLITDVPVSAALEEGEIPVLYLPQVKEEALSPCIFLVPLQLLAERVAVYKGLDVDGFRYLSKVVSEYVETI